jgi:hypothetical protein
MIGKMIKNRLFITLIIAAAFFAAPDFSVAQFTKKSRERILESLPEKGYNWRCMGPSGMPNLINKSEMHGVGQIHRITFDPFYDGSKNKTVYAASSFGGLWRSDDDGLNWQNVNTDFLPSTSVADVCINPFNRNELFICTGYADGGLSTASGPNWTHINPIPTHGIYRSKDFGVSWENISDGFIETFKTLGMCRKMEINPMNPDQIFIATTQGIFRTNSATSSKVTWQKVFSGKGNNDDFRGLAFKPDDANTIYASGTDIYISENGGKTWKSLTGIKTGLDLQNMPDSFAVKRINIAVTPAAPDRLYAYLIGTKKVKNKTSEGGHIAIFEDGKWRMVESRFSSGVNYFADCWIAIAVSPVNADMMMYGNTRVIGTEKLDSIPFDYRSVYCGGGFHADVHDLEFQPNVANPKLFCGNHGGVSIKTFPNKSTGWEYRNEGLEVTTIWSFDDSETDETNAIIATQDDGTLVYCDTLGFKWHFIQGGDGYSARIDDRNPDNAYFSSGDKSLARFNFSTLKTSGETPKLPKDPINKGDVVISTKTFPMVNMPGSGEALFGFTELFLRKLEAPTTVTPITEIWEVVSDIGKTEPAGWKRQITEIAICKSKPDVIYVVTAGQQNPPGSDWQLKSGLYKTTTGIKPDETKTKFTKIDYPGENHDNDTLAIITGIAVDPLNADRVWITFTGIPSQYRIWLTENGGRTWTNADPKGILGNNPVNAIAYRENSSDQLFIGTDKGLYKKDRLHDWEKVKDFPSVRITEIKINKGLNRLRIATFGRGLWEGNLGE